MKSSNPIVTIVIVGAVLVAAYAVGLLIRQARVGESPSPGSSATEVNEAPIGLEPTDLAHAPGTGRSKDSLEAKAKRKEKRAELLQKMESATEEEKAKLREQVREKFTEQKDKKTPTRKPARPTPVVRDPNASQSSEKTDSEPNRVGES